MFKNIYKNIATLLLVATVGSTFVGCQSSDLDNVEDQAQGALVLSITRSSSESSSSLPDDTTLRIYNSSDRLIARYSLEEIPSAIYLAAGSYKATVTIGTNAEISDSLDDISYYGEQEFVIEGGKVSSLEIPCTILNTIVAVVFDDSVYERFELEATSYLSLSNSFSLEGALDGSVPTLTFNSDGCGYFILPDDVNNVSWGFYGESASTDPTTTNPSTTAEFSGAIENPAAATKYTLRFAYTATPDGSFELSVSVDESVEEWNDIFNFSPQPTFKGSGFDLYATDLSFTGEDLVIDVTSINDLSEISISSSEFAEDIMVMEGGSPLADIAGVSYTETSSKAGVLTLSTELFALFGQAGSKSIRVSATDTMDSEGHEDMTIEVSGVTTPTFDLWNNSAVLTADVILDSASSVKFAYQAAVDGTWREVEATKGDGNSYSAEVAAEWSSSTNSAGLAIYTLACGFSANSSYQYKLIVDDMEYAVVSTTTSGGQAITNGNLNSSSITAFTSSNSSSSDWASGNNTFSSDLCSQVTKDGNVCAYLKSRTAAGVFAAGNLAYGQFAMSGFSGTMSFGQSYTWTARPRTFKFRYAATIGDETHDDDNRLDGKDRARVYFAIVDWSSRHGVTAGTSGNPSGVWDPTTQTSTDEGNIIGYASIYIDDSTSGDGLYDVEIPIEYYDSVTKPSKTYSIVISCAASAYGDYMTGSTDSRLWVDDFELGY